MIFKEADTDEKYMEYLKTQSRTNKRAKTELRNRLAGIKAERDSAYMIDFHHKGNRNSAVIHDLRLIDADGRVAQIDHLIFSRFMQFYIIETKGFHAGIKIEESGNFLRWNSFRKCYEGIPSPIAQNERHLEVLKTVFQNIDGWNPAFHSLIMVSNQSRIIREKQSMYPNVIKADDFIKAQQPTNISILNVFKSLLGHKTETEMIGLAEQLVSMHQPLEHAMPNKVEKVELEKQPTLCCSKCSSKNITIANGRYGYYLKCMDCNGNTPLKLKCSKQHKERIKKKKKELYRECRECGTSRLFFEIS